MFEQRSVKKGFSKGQDNKKLNIGDANLQHSWNP
jgi:hypothetical protein